MADIDPVALGYFEKTPGSGIWYRREGPIAYEVRTCQNPACLKVFMARKAVGNGKYCCRACFAQAMTKPGSNYSSRHDRVRRARGRAAEYACADCGQAAREWSQVHGTSGEQPQDYEARCIPCHRAYDNDTRARGEARCTAKLTDARVRGLRASVGASQDELAQIHGVSQQTVSAVLTGERWAHVA